MSPSLRSSGAIYGRIDPGSGLLPDDDFQDVDMDMITEEEIATDEPVESGTIDLTDTNGSQVELPRVSEYDPVNLVEKDRIVIAIDFGTTFSSVAYAILQRGVPPERIGIQEVRCIGNYPGYISPRNVQDLRQDVPTELWYDDGSIQADLNRAMDALNEEQGSEMDENEVDSSDDELVRDVESRMEDYQDARQGFSRDTQNTRDNITASSTQYWGFNVQKRLNMEDITRETAQPLTRFKLMLEPKDVTETVCNKLRQTLTSLKKKKIIKKDTDIYKDFLTHLLKHTKSQLELSHELREGMSYQLVLCVPAKWSLNACRIMQGALEDATKDSGLSQVLEQNDQSIFMISEPEAATECILAEANSEVYRGETIVIIDAGGGTIDAVTYKCESEIPLRLSEEVVAPDCQLRGASFINERFEAKLLEKLEEELYLETNNKTFKSIVQAQSTLFENDEKRRFDANDERVPLIRIRIEDLRPSRKNGFRMNYMELQRKTVRNMFADSLKGVVEVLESQLQLAESKGHCIEKVILTGGFGQSPSLQSHLREYLQIRMNTKDRIIDMIVPQDPSTAVARGAVLRALNKNLGPSRITQCSYGFLVSEPYEPQFCVEHQQVKCRISMSDGERYVNDTIRWLLQAGDRVNNMEQFPAEPFVVRHTFPCTRTRLICKEELWMSDFQHPQHYRKSHPLNRGAVMVASIESDMSFLIEKKLIEKRLPTRWSTDHGQKKYHWEVVYEIAMIVEGRSMRFEARYPARENLRKGERQEVQACKHINIVAAFRPGTA